MWLIHEHCKSTSAIDKYWVFATKELALSSFHLMLDKYKNFVDLDFLQELFEENEVSDMTFESFKDDYLKPNDCTCINLTDGDYLVLTDFNEGFARRP